jgi:hypothetical protein
MVAMYEIVSGLENNVTEPPLPEPEETSNAAKIALPLTYVWSGAGSTLIRALAMVGTVMIMYSG